MRNWPIKDWPKKWTNVYVVGFSMGGVIAIIFGETISGKENCAAECGCKIYCSEAVD